MNVSIMSIKFCLNLEKFEGKKKFRKVIFFLVFGLKKITKKKNMEGSLVEKILEISDKIFFIKL